MIGGQKVYPPDHPEREFLGQLNHPLAAAAEKPFLTTEAEARAGFTPQRLYDLISTPFANKGCQHEGR